MSRKINVGVVGLGYWGPNLARNIHSLDSCHLKAVCDFNEDRLDHFRSNYPLVEQFKEFDSFLLEGDLDAVILATGAGSHYQLAEKCLLAGKHVLVEKPLSISVADCSNLSELARSNGLILMVSHTFLYSPAVRKIKQIVDSGEIGEIRYISARRLNLGIFQDDINVSWDLAPHDISIILHILGESPLMVNCQGCANITPGIEDVATMHLRFSGQRSAVIQSSWLDPRKVREMTIVGSKKMIVYDDVAQQQKIKIFDTRVEKPMHYDTFAEFHYAYHYGEVHIPHVQQEEPLRVECQHFINCINSGQSPLTGGPEGTEVVRILEASSESLARNGAPVALKNKRDCPASQSHENSKGSIITGF